MLLAFAFSSLFLVSYIVNHALHGDTIFPGHGAVRTLYLSILASHILLSIVALHVHPLHSAISGRAWLGFGYVGVVSMYLGFFAWYRGLTRTTIARASQVQLAQPVLGMFWSWLLLGERLVGEPKVGAPPCEVIMPSQVVVQ